MIEFIVEWLFPNNEPSISRIVGVALLLWIPLFFNIVWRDHKERQNNKTVSHEGS